MNRFDIIEIGTWALDGEKGYIDSLRVLRERNPDLVVLLYVVCSFYCSNWGNQDLPGKAEWDALLAEHDDDWLLRDVDGDLVRQESVEMTCDNGRLNYIHNDMARAYARFIADSLFMENADVLDGIRLDAIVSSVYYMNNMLERALPGLDSIDTNQDGIPDNREDLLEAWSAGVDTFTTTLRRQLGPERLITFNGAPPLEAYQWLNGRYVEEFPFEYGVGWEGSMLNSKKGYLSCQEDYSDQPRRLSGGFTLNCVSPHDYDPYRLSTKDEPYPHPMLPQYLRFTLGSALLGDGWYTMTGWGNTVDWKDDPVPIIRSTLWWFDLYDTLRTHLGTPTGEAVRDTANGLDRFVREYTGGRVRVYPQLERGIFDLRPHVAFHGETPETAVPGEAIPIRWSAEDPNGAAPLEVELRLSRDGGATFPERIDLFGRSDSLTWWTVDGEAGESCVFHLTAADTSGLSDTVTSAPFLLSDPRVADGGAAEVHPAFWIVNTPALYCTLSVAVEDTSGKGSGWDRADLFLPAGIAFLSFAGAEREGAPLTAAASREENVVRIALAQTADGPEPVHFRLLLGTPSLPRPDSLLFSVSVEHSSAPGETLWLPPGNGNGIPGDGDGLAVLCDFGPPAELSVEPPYAILQAGDTLRFDAEGWDQAGNSVEVEPIWSAVDSIGVVDGGGLFLALRPGSLSVAASVADLEAYATIRITAGDPESLLVLPESLAVTTDDSALYEAWAWDGLGNPIDTAVAWSVEDTIASIDSAGHLEPERPGSTFVIATLGALEARSPLRIAPGAPALARIEPRSPAMGLCDSISFTCDLFDLKGNPTGGTVLWSVTDGVAAIDSAGLLRPVAVGEGWVRAACGAVRDSVPLRVLSSAVVSWILEPSRPTVSADSTLLFTMRGVSCSGETLAVFPDWILEGGAGALNDSGVFTPLLAGEALVIADAGAHRETTTVTVTPGAPAAVAIDPREAETEPDSTILFHAVVTDRLGNPIDTSVAWAGTDSVGSIDGGGLFTAIAPGRARVTATRGDAADTAWVTVRGPVDPGPVETALYRIVVTDARADGPEGARADSIRFTVTPHDSLGDPFPAIGPESLQVTFRPLDPTLLFCGGEAETFDLHVPLPAEIALPAGGAGGWGSFAIEATSSLARFSVADTAAIATADPNGDLRAGLEDAALLLADRASGGSFRSDLDGNGTTDLFDMEALAAAWGEGCGDPPAEGTWPGELPLWIGREEFDPSCAAGSTSTLLSLYAGSIDSLRALEISLPNPTGGVYPVDPVAGIHWKGPAVYRLPSGKEEIRLFVVDTVGAHRPAGDILLEVRFCGVEMDDFAGGHSLFRTLRSSGVVTDRCEAPIEFHLDTDDDEEPGLDPDDGGGTDAPVDFALFPARPNPFRSSASIRYRVAAPGGSVWLGVYNVRGERIAVLENGHRSPGEYDRNWDGRDVNGRSVSPGAYFVLFRSPAETFTRKVVLVP
ncbi:MAG: Ig-like domain-containing protein [Candidatus Eisenbacteria bacterium]|nr:Ig-like domain-containing protein [Candidatus Eisenbacteria bacterium]